MNQTERLGGIFHRYGIKAGVFDIDDTLTPSSRKVWEPAHNFIAQELSGMSDRPIDIVRALLEEFNNRLSYESVHPRKYAIVAGLLAKDLELDPKIVAETIKTARRMIYWATPDLYEEAREVMNDFGDLGLELAVLSHSAYARVSRIVNSWKLPKPVKGFGWSMFKNKGPEAWQYVFEQMGIQSNQAVAVDDNLKSIQAAKKLGVEMAVWIRPVWSVYDGEAEGIPTIDHIRDMVPALISHFG